MSHIKNVFSSITYYKKYNMILFFFFSVALLSLTYLLVLDETRELKFSELSARWDIIYKYLPGMKTDGFETFSTASHSLKLKYLFYARLAVAGIGLSLMLLTGTLLFWRRRDIKALLSMGIKKWRVIFQLIVEALFPIIFSFFAILTLVLLFQSSFKALATTTNTRLFNDELPSAVNIGGQRTDANVPDLDTKRVLVPFNEHSFYYMEGSDATFSYHNLFSTVSLSFIFLLFLSFIAVSLTTAGLVSFLAHTMYY